MAIKTKPTEDNVIRKERFEFVLTVNDNIICQRYFKLFRFKPQSLSSVELTDAIDRCVDIIDGDIKSKASLYLDATAPQIFNDEDEMNNWLAKHPHELEPVSYIILRNSDAVFVWTGETVKPYNKYFNRADYLAGEELPPCVLKFTLFDNGINLDEHVEVISKAWDGNAYPRFVRNNIDITNSKNRYKNPDNFSAYEASLIDYLNEGRRDISPRLIREIEKVCTFEPDETKTYTNKVEYGNTTYWLNVKFQEELRLKSIEKQCQRKTDKYFKED